MERARHSRDSVEVTSERREMLKIETSVKTIEMSVCRDMTTEVIHLSYKLETSAIASRDSRMSNGLHEYLVNNIGKIQSEVLRTADQLQLRESRN